MTIGLIAQLPNTAAAAPMMPALKLSTSISKPALVRSWTKPSNSLSAYAAAGPMIIAPRNIGMPAPTTTPIVATAPTTAPRWPCTIRPPV